MKQVRSCFTVVTAKPGRITHLSCTAPLITVQVGKAGYLWVLGGKVKETTTVVKVQEYSS